jgi:hypothetical protein
MQIWRGWTTISVPAVTSVPTWEEWCASQRRILSGGEKHQQARQPESGPFSDRELARLSFLRWLYQQGVVDPAQIDNV